MPQRTLTLSEAYQVAELQAAKLIECLGITGPAVDVARLTELPKIEVRMEPRHRMPSLAGFSQWADGRWLIVVNRDGPTGRRRFTLAHEFKHVLDHPSYKVAYKHLGRGDQTKHDQQIELVCNYFAACFLMPRTWVKRAYASGIQDEEALAGLFKVSVEAMHNRLIFLGLIGDDRRPIADYFRADGRLTSARTVAA
ncbi:ImmA/IrrE family metallo-endopeptidase [Nocardioides sp. TRM66260-LWL]|uniref:ImmA/IrrE family metallo-endopeptidase n=1 Tax=Nocardioides sp. TRM66260-LWL TaxID=2874478 RepID=UPI001CC6526C|nr:ImmA/IrrE family metallo-endopeptidase [Nocardioides sp. TRM66260-LWL]MBZ5735122.1 ImmA/IrrE family metallo-endopeptidase [Nocardioides sp. TRM66260-LWL]